MSSSSPHSASPSSPAQSYAALERQYGPCAGDPLPTVPPVDETKKAVTVQWANRSPCEVPDDANAVQQLLPHIASRRMARSDCVQYAVEDGDGLAVRRGVLVGALKGSLVVLERRRVDGNLSSGGFTSAAVCIAPTQLATVDFLPLGRCRHCGCFIPMDEARLHVDRIHKAGDRSSTRVDDVHGLCVGNVDLLLSLRPIRKLGEGAQGLVSLCERPPNVQVEDDVRTSHYVLKQVACRTPEEASARYQQAVRLMALKHSHVIRYLAVQRVPSGEAVRMVMPYYQEKDLAATIRSATGRLDDGWVSSVVLQLCTALRHLHSHSPPILHGDLKPENVLLFNKMNQVILMDFDTSVEVGRSTSSTESSGTFEWMAPEAVAGGRCTVASDVWSLGLLAYVLLVLPEFPMLESANGEALLLNSPSWNPVDLRRRVEAQIRHKHYAPDLTALVLDMMEKDPARRPSAATACERMAGVMENALLGGGG